MTDKTDIAALMRDMRDLAYRIVECQGENSDGEEIIHLYDQSDTTFKAQNILLVLNAFEAERQRAAGSEEELHKALHREKAAERKLLAAQGEIEALKGDQVPVSAAHRMLGEVQLAVLKGLEHHNGWQPRCGWVWGNTARTLKIMDALLKKDLVSKGMNELFTINKKGLAAIESAGGIVKDGE